MAEGPDFSLQGKVALITGGARGLGFAMGCGLARAGAQIVFNATQQASVEKGLAAYQAAGIHAAGHVCDVTDEAAVKKLVASIETDCGAIDILVNNAGIINRTPLVEMPTADFRRIVEVDLTAPFVVAKAVLPAMMKRRCGKIINVCGIMSEVTRETAAAYASAKGGLKLLTRTIAAEYGAYNIQCNGIGPGYMATMLNESLRAPQADGSPHPFDRFICAQTPAGRWGRPEDLAGPVVFLASAASDFVNGHILYVDGGFLAYLGRQP